MTKDIDNNPVGQLIKYWGIVLRYRWIIFFCTLAFVLAGTTFIALMPDFYQASTTILVDPQQVPERYVSTTVVADAAQRLGTISQEVLSATRLYQIAEQYKLYPEQRKQGLRDDIVAAMRKDIAIEVKGGAISSFTITYRSTKKDIVAPVTNELAAGFVRWNIKQREQQVAGTTDFLRSELERARTALKDQEEKLGQFKIQHAGELPDQQAGNMQMLSQLQSQFAANREALNRLDVKRSILLRARDNPAVTAPVSGPLSERSQLLVEKRELERKLADLTKRYTPAFPDVASTGRRLDEVKARLQQLPPESNDQQTNASDESLELAAIDKEIKRINDEQNQVLDQIRAYQGKMKAAPIREQQILDLSRNYQVTSNNYAALLDKTYSSELAAELERRQKAERFTVLDIAQTPQRPFKPNRLFLLAGAICGSLALSLALVLAWDILNGTVNDEEALLRVIKTKTAVLATIPNIETPAATRRRKLFMVFGCVAAVVACVAEAIFLIRVKPIF